MANTPQGERHRATDAWIRQYGHVCPPQPGVIVLIDGIGDRDSYNLAMVGSGKILAFRCEERSSVARFRRLYHPAVLFARPHNAHWKIDTALAPFDMMEDPFCFTAKTGRTTHLIFGGVTIRRQGREIIPQTMFFRGTSIETLEREAFAVIDNMKDIRLLQLPDGRFLLMRRPWGGAYGRGRITLHMLDSLDDLRDVKHELPILAVLDDCADIANWVGVNEGHLLTARDGTVYVGLLGHMAFADRNGKHYAACTYTIKLSDILDNTVHKLCPRIIATRGCFADGPSKTKGLHDVVFPGHLEHLAGRRYRLWAGLSDARIGTIEVENPFEIPTI